VDEGVSGDTSEVGLDFVSLLVRFGTFGEMLKGLYRRSLRFGFGLECSEGGGRGRPEERGGAVRREGEDSTSSASPRYLGRPSTPISTLGGLRKWVLSRYSGLMSREASSGRDEGGRRRPFSTSSMR
jgi:hypothetical protein